MMYLAAGVFAGFAAAGFAFGLIVFYATLAGVGIAEQTWIVARWLQKKIAANMEKTCR
jgi:hypothetical protein